MKRKIETELVGENGANAHERRNQNVRLSMLAHSGSLKVTKSSKVTICQKRQSTDLSISIEGSVPCLKSFC